MAKAWLSVNDVCAELGIHRATWYRWVSDDAMNTPEPVSGIGRLVRYPRARFEAFLESLEGTIGGTNEATPENNINIQDISAK